MGSLLLAFSPEQHFFAFILGATRLLVVAMVAPFMANSVLPATAKTALVLALYLVLHPMILENLPPVFPLTGASAVLALSLIAKEVFLGLLLGYLAGLVFWTVQSAGQFIDNQRGASMAEETDPLSGESTTPVGSFFFQSVAYLFFASGAFAAFLGAVYATYEFWPVQQMLPAAFFSNREAALFFGKCLNTLSVSMVLLAAPVVLACLFTDIALGLINRFASQLNVYVLAMPIKCGISAFLLIIYFAVLMNDASGRFALFSADLQALKGFFGP